MALRLPHFIIAGAPRTATTWLYEVADRHPDIAMARPRSPEPKFFLVDEFYERGLPYYSATWFDPLPDRRYYGEKTTNYLESETACMRIARDLPDVRLVFLLRDPVERAYSNYLWSMRNGFETEEFDRALELESGRERSVPPALRYARPHAYFSRGLYAELLRCWFERFPREHILVLRTEDVADNPCEVAQTFHRFIGVAGKPSLVEGLGTINTARPDGTPPLRSDLRASLYERYRKPNADLTRLLGDSFVGWESPVAVNDSPAPRH
jgi:hypothetical protein